MNRKLAVGAALREVWALYRTHARRLLPVSFVLFLTVAVVDGLIGTEFPLLLIGFAISTVTTPFYEGFVVTLVQDLQDDRPDRSIGELLRATILVLLPLVGAGLLFLLGIFVGVVLFVVPALVAITVWALISPVIVVERPGVTKAFSRSHELVRGNGWRVFGVVLASFLAVFFIAGIGFKPIAEAISSEPLVQVALDAVTSTLVAPIAALVAAVLYFRLRQIDPSAP